MNSQHYLNMRNKIGEILIEDLIYIILVIVFFSILFLFVSRQGANTALLEERTAKQIALTIDAAEVGTQITINLEKVLEKKQEEIERPIKIDNNKVNVELSQDSKGGYTYGYFNGNSILYKMEGGNLILEIK